VQVHLPGQEDVLLHAGQLVYLEFIRRFQDLGDDVVDLLLLLVGTVLLKELYLALRRNALLLLLRLFRLFGHLNLRNPIFDTLRRRSLLGWGR